MFCNIQKYFDHKNSKATILVFVSLFFRHILSSLAICETFNNWPSILTVFTLVCVCLCTSPILHNNDDFYDIVYFG